MESGSVNIRFMPPLPTKRRRLHNTVRRTILSYYTEEEAARVKAAAKKEGMSISNFVASAALKEADKVSPQRPKH